MANPPSATDDMSKGPGGADGATVPPQRTAAAVVSTTENSATISVLEETLSVGKRRRSTGRVRVMTRTETVEAFANVELERQRVEVTRVPVERVVDEAPAPRTEGDTTVIPVVEERLVVVKQLVLVEELRIRLVHDQDMVSEPVTLRRQRAVIERLGPQGEVVDE